MGKQQHNYVDLIKPHEIQSRLSTFVVEVMERMEKSVGCKNIGFRGACFELGCVDMLLKEGVDRKHIYTAGQMKTRWPKTEKYSVDIDVSLVNEERGVYAPFLLKTSFRERWKMLDRDAHLANTYIDWKMLGAWVLFFNEKATKADKRLSLRTHKNDLPRLRKKCRNYEFKCSTRIDFYCIYEIEILDTVWRSVIEQVS